TTSLSSALASSTPATSLKRVFTSVSTKTLALLFPMASRPPPPIRFASLRLMKTQKPKRNSAGISHPTTAPPSRFSRRCPTLPPRLVACVGEALSHPLGAELLLPVGERLSEAPAHLVVGDGDLVDVLLLQLLLELAVRKPLHLSGAAPVLDEEQRQHRQHCVEDVAAVLGRAGSGPP